MTCSKKAHAGLYAGAQQGDRSDLLVHSCCNVFISHGHVLSGRCEHTLHERALAFQVVIHRGGDCQVSKAAEVCICTVQQIVQALTALQDTAKTL